MEIAMVYSGLMVAVVGLVCLIRPLAFLRIRSRRHGVMLFAFGLLATVAGAAFPPSITRLPRPSSRLDDAVPEFQFHEVHATRIRATPERIMTAVKSVTPDEIRFFRTLTWIRAPHFKRPTHETILTPSAGKPILDAALASGFIILADDADRELVIGTLVVAPAEVVRSIPDDAVQIHEAIQQGWRTERPGYVRAALNFQIEDQGNGSCRLTTETRVFATDSATSRRFAVYWRLIYPGSAVIRRMWLDAIRRRAEATP
jgi:hypothetical protein